MCIDGMHALLKYVYKKNCSYKYNNKEYSIMGSVRWGWKIDQKYIIIKVYNKKLNWNL